MRLHFNFKTFARASLFIIYAIRKPKTKPKELPTKQSNIRFVFLALGIIFQLCAVLLAVTSFYAPTLLGISQPNPVVGVVGIPLTGLTPICI